MSKYYHMYAKDSKVHLINHFKSLQEVSKNYNATLQMNLEDFQIKVSINDNDFTLHPQFLTIFNNDPICNVPAYSHILRSDCDYFTGWRPYLTTSIRAFSDKIELKKKFTEANFLTPDYSTDTYFEGTNVIVKSSKGSFCRHLSGPFKKAQYYGHLKKENSEFFEQFIFGKIVKILYWNNKPTYLEVQEMPTIKGDGINTIEHLATKRAKKRARLVNDFHLDDIVHYQGFKPLDVLDKGKEILVDFRYESNLAKCFSINEIVLPNSSFNFLEDELKRIGDHLFSFVRAENIRHLCFSVDAILDDENKLWLLEANSNPTIHHSLYWHMFETLNTNG